MNMGTVLPVVLILIAGSLALFTIIYTRKNQNVANIAKAKEECERLLQDAAKEAESKKKEAILEGKEEAHKLKSDAEREARERTSQVQKIERRNLQKEEALDKKSEALEKKEETIARKVAETERLREEVESAAETKRAELEKISSLSTEEAKELLLNELQQELKYDAAMMIKESEAKAKEEADKKAREVITQAIQKCAADHVADTTVNVVALPNDEMKGRIIGREGRNIRTLETLTGIDLIIDDTPEAVIISGFDPVRREIAKITLEKLIADGRIHPARIEEMVEKAEKEVENLIKEEGEQATFETDVHGLHPELVKLLGRLKFRTSYGQNILKHSVEVSYLAGVMAAELGLDPTIAKRAGLLHDIGKAIDQEMEGPHAQLGADIAKKYKESPIVVNAIGSHHGDIEQESIEAVLVQAADAVSAARPGARRETLEAYIKRLEKLEEVANSFEGVDKSFAIQAGRELRIMVKPEVVNDVEAIEMSRNIIKKIEDEIEYPGQIKVSVIRETRAVEYAK